jgi:hypothetical protein
LNKSSIEIIEDDNSFSVIVPLIAPNAMVIKIPPSS